MFTMGLLLLVYIPKIVMALVLMGEDIFRIGAGPVNYFFVYASFWQAKPLAHRPS